MKITHRARIAAALVWLASALAAPPLATAQLPDPAKCRWEGGSGAPARCQLEDCPEDGGQAECKEPEPAPSTPLTPEQTDADFFVYTMCDNHGPSMTYIRLWCEAAGGTWTHNLDCVGMSSAVVGGAGTMVKDEAAMVEISTTFAEKLLNPCTGLSQDDMPWESAMDITPHCRTGPTVRRNGLPLMQFRYTDYTRHDYHDGNQCRPDEKTERVIMSRNRDLVCPAGYLSRNRPNGDLQCYKAASDYCPTVGNPISPISGAKLQAEIDYRYGGLGGLEFSRYYNSQGYFRPHGQELEDDALGPLWRHTYMRRLHLYTDQSLALGAAHRPNGFVLYFDAQGREIHNRDGAAARLTAIPREPGSPPESPAWHLRLSDDSIETYSESGRLLYILTRAGLGTTLDWKNGRIQSVIDAFGNRLGFVYDADGRLVQISQPDSRSIGFNYDAGGRLTNVVYPDTTTRQYHYEDSYGHDLLTGISDEKGNRYSTYAYRSDGKVISSENAGGVNRHVLDYNGNESAFAVIDPLGTSRNYTFVIAGGVKKLAGTSQPCPSCGSGNVQSQGYDANGNLATLTDFDGNRTDYVYDLQRNLEISRTEGLRADGSSTPATRVITTQWHAQFRLPAEISEPASGGGVKTTQFSYDANGNLQQKKEIAGAQQRVWNFTHDSYGRLLSEDGPRTDVSDVTTFTYFTNDDACEACRGQLKTVTNALGHVEQVENYDGNGRMLSALDSNGVRHAFTYDDRGRLLARSVGSVNPEITHYEYDAAGQLLKTTRPDGTFLLRSYDAAHRFIEISDSDGDRKSYTQDARGNLTLESHFDALGTLERQTERRYDALNQLALVRNGLNEPTRFHRNGNGMPLLQLEPDGAAWQREYDPLMRVVKVTDPMNGTVEFAYDGAGRQIRITDPNGLETGETYDGLGNLVQISSPDTGTTTFEYDAAGNRTARTDARGVRSVFGYDALNRMISASYGSGPSAILVSYGYDAGAFGKGQLTSVTSATSHVQYVHDAYKRIVTRSETVDGVTLSAHDSYVGGRLISRTYPGGAVVSYEYGDNAKISAIRVNGVPFIQDIARQPFGEVDRFRFSFGVDVQRKRGLDGLPETITLGPPEQNAAPSAKYRYDPLRHLREVLPQTGPVTAYAYDATGNRTGVSRDGNAEAQYRYPLDSHRLDEITGTQPAGFSYDANGNPTVLGSMTLQYDAEDRLASLSNGTTMHYAYNGLGERVKKSRDGSTILRLHYDHQRRLLGEYDADGVPRQQFIYIGSAPVGIMAGSGAATYTYAVYADQAGAPRTVQEPDTQDVVWRWETTAAPFGETLPDADPDGDSKVFELNLRFPGQFYDAESGLHYNMNRDYAPALGRYIESDPVGLSGGISTYAYVDSQPLDKIDPMGLFTSGMSSYFTSEWGRYIACMYQSPPGEGNGCGAEGKDTVNQFIPQETFMQCCNAHDVCWGTCYADRRDCDLKFLYCMLKRCLRSRAGELPLCAVQVPMFYGGVSSFVGTSAYNAAQSRCDPRCKCFYPGR